MLTSWGATWRAVVMLAVLVGSPTLALWAVPMNVEIGRDSVSISRI